RPSQSNSEEVATASLSRFRVPSEGVRTVFDGRATRAPQPRPARPILLAFPPNPQRGRAMYAEVKTRVLDSFREVTAASRPAIEFDEIRVAAMLDEADAAEHVSSRLFAIYYDLLGTIDRDDIDRAGNIFQEVAEGGFTCGSVEYRNFTDQDLGI